MAFANVDGHEGADDVRYNKGILLVDKILYVYIIQLSQVEELEGVKRSQMELEGVRRS